MFHSVLLVVLFTSRVLGVSWIIAGAEWYDTDGNAIDAHGGGIIKHGDTFYWIGEATPTSDSMLAITEIL
jgi:hypothetical protein